MKYCCWIVPVLLVAKGVAAAEPIDLTADEFKMYRHYQNAMADPRVQKIKPDKQVAAIAKDAGFKVKELEKAIERAEAAGDVKSKCEANLKQALAQTPLGGRLGKVYVEASDPHAVGYLQWLNEAPAQLEEEAAVAAATAVGACPVLSTVQVWAQDKANPNARVFQALISGAAARRIDPSKAKDFASSRYIRLFEKVKNATKGDDLSGALGEGGSKAAP